MRFMMMYKPSNTGELENDTPPTLEMIGKMTTLTEEMVRAGVMIATDGLLSTSKGSRVRLTKGKVIVTDGPFTETKEIIGGYAIVNVSSKAEANALAEKFLKIAGDGECEVRQMHDTPAYPH